MTNRFWGRTTAAAAVIAASLCHAQTRAFSLDLLIPLEVAASSTALTPLQREMCMIGPGPAMTVTVSDDEQVAVGAVIGTGALGGTIIRHAQPTMPAIPDDSIADCAHCLLRYDRDIQDCRRVRDDSLAGCEADLARKKAEAEKARDDELASASLTARVLAAVGGGWTMGQTPALCGKGVCLLGLKGVAGYKISIVVVGGMGAYAGWSEVANAQKADAQRALGAIYGPATDAAVACRKGAGSSYEQCTDRAKDRANNCPHMAAP